MKQLSIDASGQLSKRDERYYGGTYSPWYRLRHGGVGSSKLIYREGIAAFDELDRGVEGEISFVTLELLQNGLLLRVNRNQRLACIGIRLQDIDRIELVGHRILIRQRYGMSRIVHRGELEIRETDGQTLRCSIIVQEFRQVLAFLNRRELRGLFHFRVSEKEAEVEQAAYVSQWLDSLL